MVLMLAGSDYMEEENLGELRKYFIIYKMFKKSLK